MTLEERLANLEKIKERNNEQNLEIVSLKAEIRAIADEVKDAELLKLRAESKEAKRVLSINTLADKYGATAELRAKFIEDSKLTEEEFTRAILDTKVNTPARVQGGETQNRSKMISQLGDVLATRNGVTGVDLKGNSFVHATFGDMARAMTNNTGNHSMPMSIVAERAMATTDFANLLINAGNRKLIQDFDTQDHTYKQWVAGEDLQDFRVNTDITMGRAGGKLDRVSENGELKEVELSENAETWSLDTYGNKFVITRKMIINDDLNAFNNMLSGLSEMAGNLANSMCYDLLRGKGVFANHTMADGKAIFHADHKNTGNATFDATSLSSARVAMRKHLAHGSKAPLNIKPKFLIVAPELEATALMLLNSVASTDDNKNSGNYNPHYQAITLIVDAELASPTEWYTVSNKRTLKAGYLAGTGRRPILQVDNSALTHTSFEGIFDFGVMAEDYRGLYRGKA